VARMKTTTIIAMASVVAALSAGHAQQPPSASATEPSLAVVVACNEEAAAATSASEPVEPRLLSLDVGQDSAPQSGSTIAQTPDALLNGMTPDRAGDLACQLAYRECLERHGCESDR
jgi:hypothetical protein